MKKAIICVDDEQIILSSLINQLRDAFGSKYTYEIASDGEEAIEVISELSNEGYELILIISDWLMPRMKGDELLIKLHKDYPNMFKILLTGHADQNAVNNAKKNANLNKCIYKPWNKDELINSIKNIIEVI